MRLSMSRIFPGAEPSPGFNFNIAMHGDTEEELDGTQLSAEWTFSSLQKFGQEFLKKLQGKKLPNKLLEKVGRPRKIRFKKKSIFWALWSLWRLLKNKKGLRTQKPIHISTRFWWRFLCAWQGAGRSWAKVSHASKLFFSSNLLGA